ncbi:MAG: cytochrome c oxidase subunit I [Pseudomonadota bacterium]|nr:cytochrome c oxidase subunit I [Pseudomonadota bacterium]
MNELPNPLPRPPDELEQLRKVWALPKGIRILTEYNNTVIGALYVATAFVFFVLGGILALLMRAQLSVPENNLVSPALYNQLFTMHGTVMMFLFAVPAVEAMGILLLPNMLGARDMPFPRLSAYAYWAYAIGGLVFFSSIFYGAAPTGGWFMNPPLTSETYSPGINEDFWLLGIGFIEISAIAGAIEIIVGVLRTRAPGMTLDRMPVFAWAMLVFALMVVFAFPAVILATALLELERAFHWPFFAAAKGGDPLLWQHLFWFFGHPEVYLIFLPAAGMMSMIVPAMARTPLEGHRLVVLALAAIGFLSFGLWVHHMFATGIPRLSLSFFEAASMAVAVPAGIQVFAWIATIAKGRMQLATPSLFVLGFLFNFVLGGLTGVMVAVIPFDWQLHDTYFIVAHLHYVLIGGMVFPLFAGFYYWAPFASRQALSERVGRWVFGLVFVGFNVAFFPMHIMGLMGMPRRVHTYAGGVGLDALNMISTVGAFMIAAGVLLFIVDVVRRFRPTVDHHAGNVWNAGTLEWLPSGLHGHRSIAIVESREPLWTQPGLAHDVEEGRYYLPRTATGKREALITSPLEGRPQYVLQMPSPGWSPFVAAVFTAAFFLLLTVKWVVISAICGLVALAALLHWAWDLDPGPSHPAVDLGGGLRVPVHATGPVSHSWWAVVILMLVASSLYGCTLFSYLYLWTVSPHVWPSPDALPALVHPLLVAVLMISASLAVQWGDRRLKGGGKPDAGLIVATVALVAAFAADLFAHRDLSPGESSYGAIVGMLLSLEGFFVGVVVVMALFTLARRRAGLIDGVRRATFDNSRLLLHYTVAQSLAGLAMIHVFPRLVG